MNVSRINPLSDDRWQAFVERHSDGSVFHTTSWLKALRCAYKYEPVAYVIEDSNGLVSGLPFCSVISFVTGRRLVSMPFSDYCQPLLAHPEHLGELLAVAKTDSHRQRFKYVEIRPLVSPLPVIQFENGFVTSDNVIVHKLDVSRREDELLQTFHASSIRRKIAKTSRSELRYEEGHSEKLLATFYRLLLMTRRRHGIPPQPLRWFRALIDCFGKTLRICVASKDDTPIASILTLSFKNTLVYKYGCSDPKYNSLGGTVFLFWRSIRHAKENGISEFDLGRSDYSTPGLITFKDRWGAVRTAVNYYRSGASVPRREESRLTAAAKRLLVNIPDPMFSALGGLLYRHVG
jgi:CelD/BcsL family acetyltransferase involved in cellulose biosynthesis